MIVYCHCMTKVYKWEQFNLYIAGNNAFYINIINLHVCNQNICIRSPSSSSTTNQQTTTIFSSGHVREIQDTRARRFHLGRSFHRVFPRFRGLFSHLDRFQVLSRSRHYSTDTAHLTHSHHTTRKQTNASHVWFFGFMPWKCDCFKWLMLDTFDTNKRIWYCTCCAYSRLGSTTKSNKWKIHFKPKNNTDFDYLTDA